MAIAHTTLLLDIKGSEVLLSVYLAFQQLHHKIASDYLNLGISVQP